MAVLVVIYLEQELVKLNAELRLPLFAYAFLNALSHILSKSLVFDALLPLNDSLLNVDISFAFHL